MMLVLSNILHIMHTQFRGYIVLNINKWCGIYARRTLMCTKESCQINSAAHKIGQVKHSLYCLIRMQLEANACVVCVRESMCVCVCVFVYVRINLIGLGLNLCQQTVANRWGKC